MSAHTPHWLEGAATKAAHTAQAENETLAHLTYGQVVKHFGLGTTHTFSSWGDLPPDERAKWIAAVAEVQAEVLRVQAESAEQRH